MITFLLLSRQPGSAALTLLLTGTSGSPLITLSGGGTLAGPEIVPTSVNSSFLQLPDPTPRWRSARNNLGDFLEPSWTASASEGRELPLAGNLRLESSGSVSFAFTFVSLRLDDDSSAGGDDLDLRFDQPKSYPAYSGGLVLTLAGSATTSLGDGNTFDDLRPGTYSLPGFGDTGDDQLRVVIGPAIPEPNTLILFLAAGAGLVWHRRFSHASQPHK